MNHKSKKVFITGATSGIGESLAYVYAKQGATIGLAGRRSQRLEEVSIGCREAGGNSLCFP